MFHRDNFVFVLFFSNRSVLWHALKECYLSFNGEHDKVHVPLIMEALGQHEETVHKSKLPLPAMTQIYAPNSDSHPEHFRQPEII